MILLCGGQKLHSFINEAFLHCAQNNLCIKPCSVTTGADGTVYVRLLFTVYLHLAYYKPDIYRGIPFYPWPAQLLWGNSDYFCDSVLYYRNF